MSEPDVPRRYALRIAGPAARSLAEGLPEKVATAVYAFITTTLLENPHRVGRQLLLPPYAGTWSARRGTYRVLYEIDEKELVVTVTAVEQRTGDRRVMLRPMGDRLAVKPSSVPRRA